jgi:hypothetical protein
MVQGDEKVGQIRLESLIFFFANNQVDWNFSISMAITAKMSSNEHWDQVSSNSHQSCFESDSFEITHSRFCESKIL